MASENRRLFLGKMSLVVGGVILGGSQLIHGKSKKEEGGKEVGAVEDLMREHGVLRRALLAYRSSAQQLRGNPAAIPTEALVKTAQLFRSFGEDYHERKLEEENIFPMIRKIKGKAAAYPDLLVAQHNRGREITDYVLKTAAKKSLPSADAESLATTLDTFVLMYEHHAAREDTIVFPAWKNALSQSAYKELGDKFEDIEKSQFGKDGFEAALATMDSIEQTLGITDIAQFTPPAPAKMG
jgi:hemerythrin-like domain-containing protein